MNNQTKKNNDWIQTDPTKIITNRIPRDPMKTHLHTPSDKYRRTIGMGSNVGIIIPTDGLRRHHTVPTKTLNLIRTRAGSLPPTGARGPPRPKCLWRRGGQAPPPTGGGGNLISWVFSRGRGKRAPSFSYSTSLALWQTESTHQELVFVNHIIQKYA